MPQTAQTEMRYHVCGFVYTARTRMLFAVRAEIYCDPARDR